MHHLPALVDNLGPSVIAIELFTRKKIDIHGDDNAHKLLKLSLGVAVSNSTGWDISAHFISLYLYSQENMGLETIHSKLNHGKRYNGCMAVEANGTSLYLFPYLVCVS